MDQSRRTPESEFYRPILAAVKDLGGSANLQDVLDRIQTDMESAFTERDWAGVPTRKYEPTWRNTARFERKHLVLGGLLSADSAKGQWEITTLGQKWLAEPWDFRGKTRHR